MNKIPYFGATGYVTPLKTRSSELSILSFIITVVAAFLMTCYIIKYHILTPPRLAADSSKPDGGTGLNWNS
jgi:hypothetical protein